MAKNKLRKSQSIERTILGSKWYLIGIAAVWFPLWYLLTNFIYSMLHSTLLVLQDFTTYQIWNYDYFQFNGSQFTTFHGEGFGYLVYGFIGLLVTFGYAKYCYKIRKNYASIIKNQHGDSSFTTKRELKQQYRQVPNKNVEYKGKGGVLISQNNRWINKPYKWAKNQGYKNISKMIPYFPEKVFIDDSPVNNLIIGISRSGKGETQVFPMLDIYSRAEEKSSLIVNDPKGELAAASKDTLEARGYDVHILNLLDPDSSLSYNPLELVVNAYKNGEYDKAVLLSNTFSYSLYNNPDAKDPFFDNAARSLCTALILAVTDEAHERGRYDRVTPYTVAHMLSSYGAGKPEAEENEGNLLDEYFMERSPNDPARLQYSTINFAKNNTRAAVMAVAMEKLSIFLTPSVGKMTAKNSLDLTSVGFGEKPVAVFMVTPDYDASLHAIPSIFVAQLTFQLSKQASVRGGKCEREVIFLLDEFGNMPAIAGMNNTITVCLGRNIRFNLIVQNFEQVKRLYGEDEATIIGNCGNQIYILTSSDTTAEKFSKLIGTETILNVSRSGKSLSDDKSFTESAQSRRLMLPEELMSLYVNESIVVRSMKRQDLKRKSIESKPIYNTGELELMPRWMFLGDQFDNSKSINDVRINTKHRNVILSELTFDARGVSDRLNKISSEVSADKIENYKELIEYGAKEMEDTMLQNFIQNNYYDLTISQYKSLLLHCVKHQVLDETTAREIYTHLERFYTDKENDDFKQLAIKYSNESHKLIEEKIAKEKVREIKEETA